MPGDEALSAAAHAALASRVQTLRAQSHMTQGQLAERAGLTQSYVSKLERGSHSVGLDTLLGLQRALGLASIEDLFGPAATPAPTPTARIISEHG